MSLAGRQLQGPLIVSCQAPAASPLHGPHPMVLMARAAHAGGATGIRAEGVDDIKAIRQAVALPIVGLIKRSVPGSQVYITPNLEDAAAVADAGADAIAVDATLRPRSDGSTAHDFIRRIVAELGVPVVADVDTLEAALRAEDAGAAYVATTLAGYTNGDVPDGPDVELVSDLHRHLLRPILAEGRYHLPQQVQAAIQAGAFAVVVGEAVTDPVALTRRLVAAATTASGSIGADG